MNCRGVRQYSALDPVQGKALEQWPPVLDAPRVQDAQRADEVRNATTNGPERPGRSGEGKKRMDMDQIVVGHMRGEPTGERPGDGIEAALTTKVQIRHPTFHHGLAELNREPIDAVIVRRCDIHK